MDRRRGKYSRCIALVCFLPNCVPQSQSHSLMSNHMHLYPIPPFVELSMGMYITCALFDLCVYQNSLNPEWCSIVNITDILYLPRRSRRPACSAWLAREENINVSTFEIDIRDDDRTEWSWNNLSRSLQQVLEPLNSAVKVDGLMISDI